MSCAGSRVTTRRRWSWSPTSRASPRGGAGFRRARGRSGSRPAPRCRPSVPVTRVTVIDATPLADGGAARDWLEGDLTARDGRGVGACCAGSSRRTGWPRPTRLLADPDVRRARSSARIGFGSGEQVADGLWEAAVALPADRRGRRADTRPVERLAALMAGRDAALACEELALRARADLDAGRDREAAIQLEAALRRRAGRARGLAHARRPAGPDRRARDLERAGRRRPRPPPARERSIRPTWKRPAPRWRAWRPRYVPAPSTPPSAASTASSSSTTSPESLTVGHVVVGRLALGHDRELAALAQRVGRQLRHRVDLERGADRDHQPRVHRPAAGRAASPARAASRRTARRRA